MTLNRDRLIAYQVRAFTTSALGGGAVLLQTGRGAFTVQTPRAVALLDAFVSRGAGAFVRMEELDSICTGDAVLRAECLSFFGDTAELIVPVHEWPRPKCIVLVSQSVRVSTDWSVFSTCGLIPASQASTDTPRDGGSLFLLLEHSSRALESFDGFFQTTTLRSGDVAIAAVAEEHSLRIHPPRSPDLCTPCHRCCERWLGNRSGNYAFQSSVSDFLAWAACVHFVANLFALDGRARLSSSLSMGAVYNLQSFRRTDVRPHRMGDCRCD